MAMVSEHMLTARTLLTLGTLCAILLQHIIIAQAHVLGVSHLRWNICVHAPGNVIAIRKYNVDIRRCTRLCWRHPNCTSLQYMTLRRCCEILSADLNETVQGVTVPCVVIRREDINYGEQVSNATSACDERFDTCKDCDELSVSYGDVYGNMRHVGARMKLECSLIGNATSYPVCQANNTWSDVLDCDVCQFVRQTPVQIINNLSLRVVPDHVFTHEAADACCGKVNSKLVRMDAEWKLLCIEDFLISKGYNVGCFYIQGNFYNDEFRFENGDRISHSLSWDHWNIDPGRSTCVSLDHEYKLNDVDCDVLCGVICQPYY